MMDSLATLASEALGMPAPPGPIHDRARAFRELATALDRHAATLAGAHTGAQEGNAGQGMTAAAVQTGAHAQALADAAVDAHVVADRLEYIAVAFTVITVAVIAWRARLAASAMVNPAAAALNAVAAKTEVAATKNTVIKRLSEVARRSVERGGTKMNATSDGVYSKHQEHTQAALTSKEARDEYERTAQLHDAAGNTQEASMYRQFAKQHGDHAVEQQAQANRTAMDYLQARLREWGT